MHTGLNLLWFNPVRQLSCSPQVEWGIRNVKVQELMGRDKGNSLDKAKAMCARKAQEEIPLQPPTGRQCQPLPRKQGLAGGTVPQEDKHHHSKCTPLPPSLS